MSEHYTPTTEYVREEFTYGAQDTDIDGNIVVSFDEAATGFDRWLAGVKAEAWDEGFTKAWYEDHPYAMDASESATPNPYREGIDR